MPAPRYLPAVPPFVLRGLPARPVTRFAPSPTGRLHLGHVANAVWIWGVAQASGGRVIVRIEDHDRGRSRAESERRILDDLDWLGLAPHDESARSLRAGGPSPFRQSDNGARYEAAVERLRRVSRVYACGCSRKTIAAAAAEPWSEGDEIRYPGTCREAALAESAGRGLRVALLADAVTFDDLRHGPVTQVPAQQCGDLLLRDQVGNWTYQLSVVVDDSTHGVNLVVRGDDLLESTGRQILLGRMLGRSEPPRFLHHPLIFGPVPGVKLSKRDRASGLDQLRAAGRSPAEVLGLAACRTGLVEEPTPIPADRLGDLFMVSS